MTAKCPSKEVTFQGVETLILIGWISAEVSAEILVWNSPFRLEILCWCMLSQISGSLPFNSSYLAFFAVLCADQLTEQHEYSWHSGKRIWETKTLSRGCVSAYNPHLGCVQVSEGGGHLQSLHLPVLDSCPVTLLAFVPACKILGSY